MNTELQAAVETLGLEKFRRHIFLCTDADEPKCCPREQSLAAWNFLKARLKELNLVGPNPLVFRTRANCLRVCVRGPIARRLSRRRLVSQLRAGRFGTHHSEAFDRRRSRRGICFCPESARLIFPLDID
jgi:hypothetical protein